MQRSFEFASDLGFDIYAVDTGFVRPEFDASYIVANRNQAGTGLEMSLAVIDVGPNAAVSRILQTIQELGCQSTQVAYLILTHIHLDHAGGAGLLMQECPNAKLIVHPRGARHMIDPSALIASALAVHGQEHVDQEYGQILPIPATRVIESFDGLKIDLGSRVLECFATPGHAKHHICIWDELSSGMFTGDTFGLSYREFDTDQGAFIMPTSSPVHFDPQALRDSLQKIMQFKPNRIYVTHYSTVENVPRLYQNFLRILSEVEVLGKRFALDPQRHDLFKKGLLSLYIQELRIMGCELSEAQVDELLGMDIELNAQGMGIWLDALQT